MKYCKKCGTELEESAEFCSSCGAKVEAAESEQEPVSFAMPTQEPHHPDSSVPIPEAKPAGKKHSGRRVLAAVIAAVLVIVGAGAIVYASSDSLQNSVKQTFMKPDGYLRNVLEKSMDQNASELSNLYANLLAPVKQLTSVKENMELGYKLGIKLSLNSEFFNSIFSAYDLSDLKLESISSDMDISIKDNKTGIILSCLINDQKLLTINAASDNKDGTLYYQFPEWSNSYLKLTQNDLGFSASSNTLQMQQLMKELFNESVLSKEDVKKLVQTYSALVIDFLLNDVTVEKNVTAEASKISSTYDKYTATITEKQFYDFILAALKQAKQDETLLSWIDNMYQVISKYSEHSVKVPELRSNIDELITELETVKPDETAKIAMVTFWINDKGELKGTEFTGIENSEAPFSFGFLSTQKKNSTGYSFWIKNEDVSVIEMNGTSVEKDGVASGTIELSFSQDDPFMDSLTTDCITLDYTGVTSGETPGGTYTLSTTLLPGGSLTLTLSGTQKEKEIVVGVNYLGMTLATASISYQETKPGEISFPKDSETVYSFTNEEEFYQYLLECNLDPFLEKLNSTLGIDLNKLLYGENY